MQRQKARGNVLVRNLITQLGWLKDDEEHLCYSILSLQSRAFLPSSCGLCMTFVPEKYVKKWGKGCGAGSVGKAPALQM